MDFCKSFKYYLIFLLLTFCLQLRSQGLEANFQVSDTIGCAPLQVNFTNISNNAVSYLWDFGNGATSVMANPSITFSAAGDYTVKLIAFDALLNADTLTITDLIHVVDNPNANFTFNAPSVCRNDNSLALTNLSTGADSYHWSFGDGNSSTAHSPTHQYASEGTYTLTLIATHAQGCSDMHQVQQAVIIHPAPVSSFSVSDTLLCDSSEAVVFTDQSIGSSLTCQWSFGDGTHAWTQQASHSYGANGTFDVQLISSNSWGCTDSTFMEDLIAVAPTPSLGFQASILVGCEPLEVTFSNNSANTINENWTFGNGLSSTGDTALVSYDSAGAYTVKLVAQNQAGCADSLFVSNMIQVNARPEAIAAASDSSVCVGETVQFSSLSSGASFYEWLFNDGTTSNTSNPSHAFDQPGIYNVKLKSTASNGCSDSTVLAISVPSTTAFFTADQSKGCTPMDVHFVATCQNALQWVWDFGDGDTSHLQNPNHSFLTAGLYDIRLAIQNAEGCWDTVLTEDMINAFDSFYQGSVIDTIYGCAPMPLDLSNNSLGSNNWNWNFGNKDSSSIENPITSYDSGGVFTVKLQTETPAGCNLYVNEYATFVLTEVIPEIQVLLFDCDDLGVQLTDSTEGAISWLWNFGDGSYSNMQSPSHVFTDSGTHDIFLAVTTIDGCAASQVFKGYLDFENCLVAGGPPPAGSVGQMGGGGNTLPQPHSPVFCAPQLTNFYSPIIGATAWQWNFGDGSGSTDEHPAHLYSSAGIYTVSLITQSPSGSDTLIWNNHVEVTGPQANFQISESQTCDSLLVQFQNTSTASNQQQWSFGDGSGSQAFSTTHSYGLNNGLYPVQLQVSDSSGCTSQKIKFVYAADNALSFQTTSQQCLGDTFTIIPSDTLHYSFVWDFGDGFSSISNTPSHSYAAPGTFQITATATSTSGCVSTHLLDTLTVGGVTAGFSILDSSIGCAGDLFTFVPTDQSGEAYHWQIGSQWIHNQVQPSVTISDTGLHDVLLQIEKDGCFSDVIESEAIQLFSPMADFNVTALNHCSPFSIALNDQSSNAVSWNWKFDGTTTSGASSASHTYTSDTISLGLVVTDNHGCSDSSSMSYTITPVSSEFSSSATQGCVPWDVDFVNESIQATSWFWDFGDGTTSTAQNPTHTYTQADTFNVKLKAFGLGGCQESEEKPNLVKTTSIQAQWSMDSNLSCVPMVVNFNDLSQHASDWSWSFGDSTFASISAPSHVYTVPGNYDVTLAVIDSLGCMDTLTIANAITVPGPIAYFELEDSIGCDSALIQFNDSSYNASSWFWVFGDGNTSNVQHPLHQFGNPGSNVVTLTVQDSSGCSSSMTALDTLTIVSSPDVTLTVSDTLGCAPFEVQINSTVSNASSMLWEFGNGDQTTQDPLSYTYDSAGVYDLVLSAENQFGCTDTFNAVRILSIYQPDATVQHPGSFCSNEEARELQVADEGGVWQGPGMATSGNPFDPSIAGEGIHTLTYSIGGMCPAADTLDIEVFKAPVAAFVADNNELCGAGTVKLSASPSIDPEHIYTWTIGESMTASGAEPSVNLDEGSYSVTLRILTPDGCHDKTTNPSFIHIHDTVASPIIVNRASVLDDQSTIFEWERSLDEDFTGYAIYRSNKETANFTLIDRVNSMDQLIFLDKGINTKENVHCYKLVGQDACATTAAIKQAKAHCPVNLSVVANEGHSNSLTWTPYVGAQPDSIIILRSVNGQAPEIIAQKSSNEGAFIDTNAHCSGQYQYQIEARGLDGTAFYSMSDNEQVEHIGSTDGFTVDLSRVTVIDDEHTLIEWTKPTAANEVIIGYEVFKSADSVNYASIGQVPFALQTFSDLEARVHDEAYFYKVAVINTCFSTLMLSNEGTSIRLEAVKTNEASGTLEWNAYSGWKKGVMVYKVQRLNEQNEWETIEEVDSETHELEIDF